MMQSRWFFDSIIFGYLLLVPIIVYVLASRNWKRLAPAAAGGIIFLLVISWIVIFYGSFVEPQMIVTRDESVQLTDNPQHQFKIAVVSDLHVGPYKSEKFLLRMDDEIEKQHPDAVVLLGDFVYKKADELPHLAPLYFLANEYPVYAVLGNHDYDLTSSTAPRDDQLGNNTRKILTTLGIHVVENSGTQLANDSLYLGGLEETWTGNADLSKALDLRENPETPTIILTHNPDSILDFPDGQNVGLVLAAHTHGGQIRLPFLGPIGKIPDKLGQKYDKGFFTINGYKTFITSGIGESGPRARLFNPPEIVIMTVKY